MSGLEIGKEVVIGGTRTPLWSNMGLVWLALAGPGGDSLSDSSVQLVPDAVSRIRVSLKLLPITVRFRHRCKP